MTAINLPSWNTWGSSNTWYYTTNSIGTVTYEPPPPAAKSELDLLDDRVARTCKAGRAALG